MSPFRSPHSRSALQRLGARAAFAVPLLIFLALGIAMVGDLSAQWWLLIVPIALLVRPALTVIREGGRRPDHDWETTGHG